MARSVCSHRAYLTHVSAHEKKRRTTSGQQHTGPTRRQRRGTHVGENEKTKERTNRKVKRKREEKQGLCCEPTKNLTTLLDVYVSSFRRSHADLLCIVPNFSDRADENKLMIFPERSGCETARHLVSHGISLSISSYINMSGGSRAAGRSRTDRPEFFLDYRYRRRLRRN